MNCSAYHTEKIFDEAQASCANHSGYNLASFTSQAEIKEMGELLAEIDEGGEYWTGLKYTKSTHFWNFTDGTDTQFALKRASLALTSNVDLCVLIESPGTLRATHCNENRKYICCRVDQDDPTTVPPTSAG